MTYGCMRDNDVVEVRENVRLAIGLTEQICAALGTKHLNSTGEGKPLVPYTTDILVTRRTPPIYVALSGKLRKDLRSPSDYRSLIVEHVYWQLHDVPFLVTTELELSSNALESLRFLRPQDSGTSQAVQDKKLDRAFLRAAVRADWSAPLLEVVRAVSKEAGADARDGVRLFRELVWRGEIPCDLERRITDQTRNAVVFR